MSSSRLYSCKGILQGEIARRFPGYYYRHAAIRPITSIFDLDPERLHPTSEYPRSVNPPSAPDVRIVDLVRYRFELTFGGAGRDRCQLWIIDSPHGLNPLLVGEVFVDNGWVHRKHYEDWMLDCLARGPFAMRPPQPATASSAPLPQIPPNQEV